MATINIKIENPNQVFNVLTQTSAGNTYKLTGGKSKNSPSLVLAFTNALRTAQSDGAGTSAFGLIADGTKNKNGDISFSFEGRTVIVGKKLFGFAQRLFTTTPSDGQLFEVGAVWTAYAQTNPPGPGPAPVPNQTFTLTTGQTLYTGGTGNDTFNGSQTTFTAQDTIDGGAGTNTLNLTDNGTAAWTLPAALVSNVQTVSLRNVNSAAGSAGVTETSTITFNSLSTGQYYTAAGKTVVATANLTAAQVASAFLGTSVTGATVGGTLTGWTAGVVTNFPAQVLLTSTTAKAAVPDVVVAGTGQTGAPTVQTITFGGAITAATINVNGLSNALVITAGADTGRASTASGTAAVINAVVGRQVATANGAVVSIVSSTPISIGTTLTGTSPTGVQAAAAASDETTISGTLTNAGTITAIINNVTVTATYAAGATTAVATTNLINAINLAFGANIAIVGGTTSKLKIIIPSTSSFADSASQAGFSTSGTGTSAGIIPASPSSVVTVQGAAAISVSNADIINAANFIGSQEFISNQSTGDVTVNGLTTQSVTKKAGSGGLTANYAATATAANVKINGGSTAGAVTVGTTEAALISATVASTGAANIIGALNLGNNVASLTVNAATNLTTSGITGAGLKTITASGAAANVNIGTLPGTVTSVVGTGLTAGGFTAKLTTTANLQYKGGAGVDTVTTADSTGTGALIDGGAGTDVLVLTATNDVTTAAKVAQYVNFEVLRNQSAASVDASLFGTGVTTVQTDGTGAGFINLTAAQAANVAVLKTNANATFGLANSNGVTDVLGLTLAPSSSKDVATAIDITGLTANGFETLNVVSSSGTQNKIVASEIGNDLAFTSITSLTTLNVSGAYDLDVSAANTAKAVTVNATNTGTFAVAGNFIKGSTINGNNVLNIFTVGGADADNGSTYIGGSGKDQFTSTIALLVPNGTFDTVLKGGTGLDTLTLSDASPSTIADSTFTNVSGFENLTLSATGAYSLTTGGIFNIAFGAGVTFTAGSVGDVATTTNLQAYTSAATINVTTAAVTTTTVVTGGSAADTITVKAASYTGGAGALSVSGGAGNDTISVTSAATGADNYVVITGGAGADTITNANGTRGAFNLVTYSIGTGDSTTAAFDKITGFNLAGAVANSESDKLDLDQTIAIVANTASAQAAAGFSGTTFTIANGILAFGGTGAATLTFADKLTIANQAAPTAGNNVAFADGGNSFVFQQAGTLDTLVQITGQTVLGLTSTNTTATAGFLYLA